MLPANAARQGARFRAIHVPHPPLEKASLHPVDRGVQGWTTDKVAKRFQIVAVSLDRIFAQFSVVRAVAKESFNSGIKRVHIGGGL